MAGHDVIILRLGYRLGRYPELPRTSLWSPEHWALTVFFFLGMTMSV